MAFRLGCMGSFRCLGAWTSAFLLSAVPCIGQIATTGRIDGVVRDESGAPVSSVAVTLRNADTGIYFETLTDERGEYRFLSVPARPNYELTATLFGFAPFRAVGITIGISTNQRMDVKLKVGPLDETVTVTGVSAAVDLRGVTSQEEINEVLVQNIPLGQRNITEVATLFPGIQFSPAETGGANLQFHVRGHGRRGHGYNLDGANLSSPVLGAIGSAVSMNAVEKFEFSPGGFQAEFGEQQGGYVNIVTKSGTNKVRASYSALYMPDDFASSIETGIPTQKHDRTPGTTWFQEVAVGGPFVRDRLWYFGAFQIQNKASGDVLSDGVQDSKFYNSHLKLTYFQGPRDQWNLVLTATPIRQENLVLSSIVTPERQIRQTVDTYLVHLKQQHTFTRDWVLESQLYWKYFDLFRGAMTPGNRPQVDLVLPTGTTQIGTPATETGWLDATGRISANLTGSWKRHLVKAGVTYTIIDGERRDRQVLPSFTDRRPVGGTLTRTDFDFPGNQGDSFFPPLDNRQLSAYAQDSWRPSHRLTLDYGLRADWERVVGDLRVAPRFGFAIALSEKPASKLYGNVGLYYGWVPALVYLFDEAPRGQTLVRVDNAGSGLTGNDVVMNVFRNVLLPLKQPYTLAGTLGFERELPQAIRVGVAVSANKQYFQETSTRFANRTELRMDGRVKYVGLELTARKQMGRRLGIQGSYTYSKTEGTTDAVLTELQAPFRDATMDWDIPHAWSLTAHSVLPAGLELSGVLRYMSGRPYSITNAQVGTAVAYVDQNGNPAGRNIFRMGAFSSLDFSLGRVFSFGDTRLKAFVQVFNLANRVSVLAVRQTQFGAGEPTRVGEGRQIQVGVNLRLR